jgi:YD repeat-containing protein
MKALRLLPFFLLTVLLSSLLTPTHAIGGHASNIASPESSLDLTELSPSLIADYHGSADAAELRATGRSGRSDQGGIKETIPGKYAARYEAWKKEFLSTESGRRQWEFYDHNSNFTLAITMSSENTEGAGTGKYKWDDSGKLVAATITLGTRLGEGYPNPIYFPVMNALTPRGSSDAISQNTLAAAKIAHEIGHVIRASRMNPALYELQVKLIPTYNTILLSNGRNSSDPRLLDIAQQMGGTPVEVWQDREYWSEANAMLFISDRFSQQNMRCVFFRRIKQSVDLYAKAYVERFVEVAQSTSAPAFCWQ